MEKMMSRRSALAVVAASVSAVAPVALAEVLAPAHDPHAEWLQEWLRLDAEYEAAHERSEAIFAALPEEVRTGPLNRLVPNTLCENAREYERWALHLIDEEISAQVEVAAAVGRSTVDAVLRRGERLRTERAPIIHEHAEILGASGWIELANEHHRIGEQADAVLWRITETPAHTLAGLEAQARTLVILVEAQLGPPEDDQDDRRDLAKIMAGALSTMIAAA